jgi:hypothetical protein
METRNNIIHQKHNWSAKKIILAAIGGVVLSYLLIMTYLYFYPILHFTVQLPVNPPSVLEPKHQSIQTHIGTPRLPFGLHIPEFILVPSYSTTFYANVDGGSLVEKEMASAAPCTTSALTTCESRTTSGGQRYTLFTVKDSSGNITNTNIVFNRNKTTISIELTERPRALSKEEIDAYIDSFRSVYTSFPVSHLTPGP